MKTYNDKNSSENVVTRGQGLLMEATDSPSESCSGLQTLFSHLRRQWTSFPGHIAIVIFQVMLNEQM